MGLSLATPPPRPSPCLALCTSQPFADWKSKKEESTWVPAQVVVLSRCHSPEMAQLCRRRKGSHVTKTLSGWCGRGRAKGILSESDLHIIPSLAHDQNL